MRRCWLAAVVATIALAVASPAAAGLTPSSPKSSPTSAPAADSEAGAVQRFGACVAGGGTGDVLLLMDRSGSLKTTDPENARVAAAKYFVEQLDSDSTKNHTTVNVAVAGFDAVYERLTPWLPAAGSSARLDRTLDSLSKSNTGLDTDYWNALTGARRDLSAQRGHRGQHCSTVVWFTDGEYSIEPRAALPERLARTLNDPKPYAPDNPLSTAVVVRHAIASGEKDICRRGGVADQLRTQDIGTISIALSAGRQAPNFDFLRGLTTGDGCGKLTSPSPGEFFEVGNIRDLVFAFDESVNSAITQTEGVCTGSKVCDKGAHTFVLDDSIGSVHLLADSDAPKQRLTLVSPQGKALALKPSSSKSKATVGGAVVTWAGVGPQDAAEGGSLYVDIARARGGSLVGRWRLIFSSPDGAGKTSRTNLKIYGDLKPAWKNADEVSFTAGQKTKPLALGVIHDDGSVVDPAGLSAQTTLSASLIADDGSQQTLLDQVTGTAMSAPTPVDLSSFTTGPATLRVTLSVTTKSWKSGGKKFPGTTLEPTSKDFPVQVVAPKNYPTVGTSVTFDTVEEPRSVSAELPVTGEGCAWVKGNPTWTTTPQDVASLDFSASATTHGGCSAGPITLTLTPSAAGAGLVTGTVTVLSEPKDPSAEPASQQVSLSMEMLRPVNETVRWVSLALIFLFGILIPVGLLYLAKFLTARVPGRDVAAGVVRGPVTGSAAFTDGGVGLGVENLEVAVLEGQDRRTVHVAGRVLRARTGLGLTEPGYVVVDHGERISGAGGTAVSGKGGARLPLAVQGQWCVALDPHDPHAGDVEVTVFTDSSASALQDTLESVRRDLASTVAKLRSRAPQPPDADGSADGWTNSMAASTATTHGRESSDPWTAPSEPGHDPWGAPPSSGSSPSSDW